MKPIALALLALIVTAHARVAVADSVVPKVYQISPDEQVVASGGKVTVNSGGVVDVKAGGMFKAAGTPQVARVETPNAAITVPAAITPATLSGQLNELALQITNLRNAMLALQIIITPTPTPTATATP